MKLFRLFLIFFFFSSLHVNAQFNVGPKFGVNNSYVFQNFSLTLDEGTRKYGFHAGVFSRAEILIFYLQPEVLYMSGNGQIEAVNDLGETTLVDYEFGRMDFPILLGFKLGDVIRIGGGPVFSVLLNDSSGLSNEQFSFSNSKVGYALGLGVDVWNLVFDLRYEGSVGGIEDSFLGVAADDRIDQITFSVGLKLFKDKNEKD